MLDRCLRIYKLLKIKFMQMSEVTSTAHFAILFWKLSHGTGDPLKHHRNGGIQYYESAVESPINLWSYNYSCAYTLFSNHRSAHTTPQYQLEENPSTMSKACLSGYPESLMFWQRIVVLGWQQIWPTDTIYNQLPHTNCRHFPFFLLRSEITLTPHIIILGSRPGMMCVRSLMRITDCVSDIRIAHSQRLRNQCDRIHTHNFPRNDCGQWNLPEFQAARNASLCHGRSIPP